MNLFILRAKNNFSLCKNIILNQFNQLNKIRHFSTVEKNTNTSDVKTEEKKFEFNVEKKKIFNKKTHYRNIDIDKKLDPSATLDDQDERELTDWHKKLIFDKRYLKIQDDWQKNLIKNKKKKAFAKERFENYPKLGEQPEKFVVHNPEKSLSLPALDNKLFAVILYKGLQHKITKDDTILLEDVPELSVGDTFLFEKVMLVASNEYTSVGRPYVSTAKVLATVEERSLTDKVIVFKKKRRKGYQRNQGHRQQILMVRILKIVHNPAEESILNYHSLVKI